MFWKFNPRVCLWLLIGGMHPTRRAYSDLREDFMHMWKTSHVNNPTWVLQSGNEAVDKLVELFLFGFDVMITSAPCHRPVLIMPNSSRACSRVFHRVPHPSAFV